MARDFSGTNQKIDWGDVTIFDGGLTALTVAMWFWADSFSHPDGAISVVKKDGVVIPLIIYDTGGDKLLMPLWDSGGGLHEFAGPAIPSTGAWHLWMCRWATGSNSGLPEYNLDGASWTTTTSGEAGVTDSLFASSTANLCFGSDPGDTEDFNGRLQDVAFWNTRLANGSEDKLFSGYSPLYYKSNGLFFYAPLTGKYSPERDVIGGLTGTVTGATSIAHNKITYPPKEPIGGGIIPNQTYNRW